MFLAYVEEIKEETSKCTVYKTDRMIFQLIEKEHREAPFLPIVGD